MTARWCPDRACRRRTSSSTRAAARAACRWGCACDQETIWHTFDAFIEAAEVLEIDDGLLQPGACGTRPAWRCRRSARDGRLREWRHEPVEAEPGHRHVSHLYGLMPGYRVQPDRDPELTRAALRSVEHRLRHDYDAQGWSLGWIAAIFWPGCVWAIARWS